MRALFVFILAASLFAGCGAPDPKEDAADFQVFSLVDSSASGLNFVNRLDERPDFNIFFFDYFYNGSGVATGDVNNDGLPDVLLTANTSGNRLFINKGKLVFEDVTEKAGLRQDRWSTGAVMVDINNDGLLDMYICNGGPYEDVGMIKNELYINQGDGTFKEEAEAYGIAGFHRSTQASFFDYDKDGDLDLYVMNYADLVYRQHDSTEITTAAYPREKFPQNSGALYRNEGNGKFTDVSEQSGIMTPGFGLGLITSDFNGDGLIDIYISNDYLIPNFLFINQGDGTFKDEIKQRLDHCSYFSMGVDYADFNNDGLQDIAEVDMMPEDHVLNKTFMRAMNPDLFFQVKEIGLIPQFMFNALHVQHGYGVYSDIAQIAGAGKTDWSWTSLLGDLDNDGWRDYLVTNGFRRNLKNNDYTVQQLPQISRWMVNEQYDSCWAFLQEYPGYPLVNYLFKNNGDLTFQNVSTQWGFDIPTYSTGAALADLDGDGDLDLIINNIDQPAFLYKNNTSEQTKNNWIRFALTDKKTGRTPLNARIEITRPNGDILMEEYKTVRGYQSAMEPILHFGLGKDPAISSIRVVWPDQSVSYLKDKAVNKLHTIDRGEVQAIKENLATQPDYIFVDYTQTLFDQSFRHKEDDYYDFRKEVLLPYRQSTLGPMITVGDVNGDGAMDFFIGGAKGQAGQLYLMDPNRGFYRAPCQPWTAQAGSEDMGGAFFDFDGDGDLDLYIASGGGGEFAQGDPLLRDRVYLNDGKGCFTGPIAGAVPDVRASSGRVAAADWDGDGDIDLFVAGRTKPGQYPFPGESVLLRNDKGKLADVTDEMAPGLRNIGMVTDAKFADLNGDKRPDLILTGEWMTVKVFIQENGIFTDRSEEWGFGDKTGWWYSVALADVNQDGKMDIITGNIGLNNKFKIKEKNPLHVFANDFDENGVYDIVLSSSYKGNLVPVRGRQCSSEQMPFIKEKFPTYAQFANATLEDIYGEDKLQESLHYEANEARSMVWLNQGKSFSPLPLPNAAQIGPLLSILVVDANKDKYPDLIVGGGLADTEPETAAFDSNKGMLLIGAGDGTFKPVWLKNSGLYLASRNVRDMAMLPVGTSTAQVILVAGNNDFIQSILFDGLRKK